MVNLAVDARAKRDSPRFALAVCCHVLLRSGPHSPLRTRAEEQTLRSPTVCQAPAGCRSCHSQCLRRSLQGLVDQFGRWLSVTAVAKPMFLRKLFHSIMEPGRNEPNRGLTRQQIHDILVSG